MPTSRISDPVNPDEVVSGRKELTLALLYGPVVQFSQPGAGGENAQPPASIVAMPAQLPLSVDTVFRFPHAATLPDSLSHFCFAPVLKLHEPSELSFCLTDSSGAELYGVSVQVLCPHGTSGSKHRPVALVMLSGRPLYAGMSRLLHLLLPLAQQVVRLPTKKRTSELETRCGRNQYGMGLVMSANNTVMAVEPGGMAARERRLRPGDSIAELDGEPLGGVRLSEALRLKAEAEKAEAERAAENGEEPPIPHRAVSQRGMPPGTTMHMLKVIRTHEGLEEGSNHYKSLTLVCRAVVGLLRRREQDLKWIVTNPFWLPVPLKPLFERMNYSVPDVAYLLAACLTDQKVLLVGSDPTVLLPCAQALRALLSPMEFSSLYIPYLPPTLMSSSDAHTLLCDSTSPFLVGTHVSLHQTIAADGQTLSDELVVADLDKGEVRPCLAPEKAAFPTSLSGLSAAAPPLGGLIRRLLPLAGNAETFDEGSVQAACLEFIADLVNVKDGTLKDSNHPHDSQAKQTWQLMLDFEEDVRLRCERDGEVAPHVHLLREKLKESLSASLATVCEQAGSLSVDGGGGAGRGGGHERRGSTSNRGGDRPCAPFLAMVYASRAFRQWWLTSKDETTHEQKMCVQYRSYDLNLADHLGDHKRALQLVEASLYDDLEKAVAEALAEATRHFGFPKRRSPSST